MNQRNDTIIIYPLRLSMVAFLLAHNTGVSSYTFEIVVLSTLPRPLLSCSLHPRLVILAYVVLSFINGCSRLDCIFLQTFEHAIEKRLL